MLTSFFQARGPKLTFCRPHLDYRCVLFGPHSVLTFLKISNNICIERLHIETHLCSLKYQSICQFSFLLGSSAPRLRCPLQPGQTSSVATTPCELHLAGPPSTSTVICLRSEFAISVSGYHCIIYITGGKHKACRPNPSLHLILSGPLPCFYPAAAPSSLPLVKEQLHLYSPKITFRPLKAPRG